MSLLLSPDGLEARREAVAGPLRPLAESLARDLEALVGRDLYVPEQKALLSREGGRCAADGSLLAFDPFQPHRHVCPRCGREYEGELHDRFWIYWYQLWLAERAVHAAALFRLGVDERFGALAAAILDGYAERYASYPNVDNVLGPTRLFFSTYLESIWLLQICVATDLLDPTHQSLAARMRDLVVEPSRAIIAEYDEAGSNRQVWNDAALLASARLLGDASAAERVVRGPSGIIEQLSTGLLADGTWYEGENYHLFAHRGLWYGVTMAEEAGIELPVALLDRFQRGFATPFDTALPDFTFPSRRDSQYAVSLRQWRIAEHCELGLARCVDRALVGALERIYRDDIPRRETGRATSSADAERNAPASALTRADLSWRALLRASPSLPALEPTAPRSTLLERQGLAVFRRNGGRTYVALDYGHSGGGHGHPDRLNLLVADGDTRWLDDYGTGSYVDPSLHWYRSTLAHNAPLFRGKSQPPYDGELLAYDEREVAGMIRATAWLGEDARATRTVVVMESYLIDQVDVAANVPGDFELPMHADLVIERGASPLEPEPLVGGAGLEDGYRFAHDTERQLVPAGETVEAVATRDGAALRVWATSPRATEWWRAIAPGAPGAGERAFRLIRQSDGAGKLTFVLAWSDEIVGVEFGDPIRVAIADGTAHVHRGRDQDWQIELQAGGARSSIDLGGRRSEAVAAALASEIATERQPLVLTKGVPLSMELGEGHYRRSEQSWSAAGSPAARIALLSSGADLSISINVPVSDLSFASDEAANPYDNEHPDINGDGVQLYLSMPGGQSAWTLVPRPASTDVRIRQVDGWTTATPLRARWRRDGPGYEMLIELTSVPLALDVIVNEMPRGRTRRRGHLVMSGAQGEFVYLRGDRHDAARLIPIRIVDG